MRFFITFSIFFVTACGALPSELAMVGGHPLSAPASLGLVGLRVDLDMLRSGYCSGTVVGERLILTAAHCLRTPRGPVKFAVFSSDIFAPGAEIRAVQKATSHPSADLALLTLADPVPSSYKKIHLPPKDFRIPNEVSVTLAGFGRTASGVADDGGRAFTLSSRIANVDKSIPFLQAISGSGHGACGGDSGGPAYWRQADQEWQIGVLSRGAMDCRTGLDQYVSLFPYLDWIRTRLGE